MVHSFAARPSPFRIALGLALVTSLPMAASAAGNAPQPSICTRACWGASAPSGGISQMSALTRAIVHHTAGNEFNTTGYEASKANVRAIQNYHKNTNGWSDIGYHFLIDKFGYIFEGRSGSMSSRPRGAHDGDNTNSFGFTLMGYFHPNVNNVPTTAMLNSLYDVIAWRMPSGWTAYGSPGGSYGSLGHNVGRIDGHRRVKSTACPGDNVYNPYIGTNLSGGVIRDAVQMRIDGVTFKKGPSMFYATGSGSLNIYRWKPNGSAFSLLTTTGISSGYSLSAVGQHMAAADVNGDGRTDNVLAYQYPDGTMRLHVFLNGSWYQGSAGWFQSGPFSMSNVDGRMVGGDFNGDGLGDVAMFYHTGSSGVTIFRFLSTGSSFTYDTASISSGYTLTNVADHIAASDVNGDGRDDIVAAYQYPDNTMRLHVFLNGNSYQGPAGWFQSGTFYMSNVGGRMAGGDFNGDGRGDIAMMYANGSGIIMFRFLSTGSSFTYDSASIASGYSASSVGKHFAAGDVDGDADDDVVVAYQYPDGTFRYHIFFNGISYGGPTGWFQSGAFNLANVSGRMTMGTWD